MTGKHTAVDELEPPMPDPDNLQIDTTQLTGPITLPRL